MYGVANFPRSLAPTAGADIKEISGMDGIEARSLRYLEDLCSGMRAVRKPMLAAVEGMAVGTCVMGEVAQDKRTAVSED